MVSCIKGFQGIVRIGTSLMLALSLTAPLGSLAATKSQTQAKKTQVGAKTATSRQKAVVSAKAPTRKSTHNDPGSSPLGREGRRRPASLGR